MLSQRSHWALIEGSSVVVAQIRFVRIRILQPGQWTRAFCIMEPIKRFSLDSLPGNALCRTQHHLSPTLPSSITLPLHIQHPPLGSRVRTSGETLSCQVSTLHLSPCQSCLLLSTYVIIISWAAMVLTSSFNVLWSVSSLLPPAPESHYCRHVGHRLFPSHTTTSFILPGRTPSPHCNTTSFLCLFHLPQLHSLLEPLFPQRQMTLSEFCEP